MAKLGSHRRIPVDHLDVITRLSQPLPDLLGNQYRPVLSSGAAKCNCQVALSFAHVVRNEISQQFRNARDELLGLWKREDVASYLRVSPGIRSKLRYEM